MMRLVLVLWLLPSCTRDWDRFHFADDATVCRWDDPGAFTLEEPRPLTEINSPARDLEPFLSADRLTLYFASKRGDNQIRSYQATRSRADGAFDHVEEQSGLNVPDAISRFALSSDGLTAYIAAPASYPAASTGQSDLFVATRSSPTAPFTSAQFQPIASVNTVEDEWDPFPSFDGLRL